MLDAIRKRLHLIAIVGATISIVFFGVFIVNFFLPFLTGPLFLGMTLAFGVTMLAVLLVAERLQNQILDAPFSREELEQKNEILRRGKRRTRPILLGILFYVPVFVAALVVLGSFDRVLFQTSTAVAILLGLVPVFVLFFILLRESARTQMEIDGVSAKRPASETDG